jgi:membrane protein
MGRFCEFNVSCSAVNIPAMARLRDAEAVIRKTRFWKFILKIYKRIQEDNLLVWASALAYSWLFSLFPFLIVVLTLMPYLPAGVKHGAEDRLRTAVMELPPRAAEAVSSALEEMLRHPPRGLLSTGLVVMIWAASSGMSMTMYAMDRCWKVVRHRPYYRHRALAILLTIIEVALILGVLILLPIGTIVTRWMTAHLTLVANYFSQHIFDRFSATPRFVAGHATVLIDVWQLLRYGVALILMFLATALIYYFGPNVKRPFRWVTAGSIFTVAVWLILGGLFRLYVHHFGKTYQMYGTVGGVAVLLLFFYVDAVVLLIGSEINYEIENGLEHGRETEIRAIE